MLREGPIQSALNRLRLGEICQGDGNYDAIEALMHIVIEIYLCCDFR